MKLKNILEANICAFGQTIFDMFSLENDEFSRALDYYITDNNFEEVLEEYAYQFEYDLYDIKNKCDNCSYENKEWNYMDIMDCSNTAFLKTTTKDKTIEIEALIDNIVDEFNKINKVV